MSAPEKAVRALLYFLLYIPVFLGWDLGVRLYGIAWSWIRPSGRIRRMNLLIRTWGVTLALLAIHVLDVRLRILGKVPEGRFLVVSNHQSTADIPFYFYVFRNRNCKFVTKRELGRWIPSVSVATRNGGFGLISRKSSRADLKVLRDMGRELEPWDGCAVVFAEATRSRDGRLLPYRSAAAEILARESRLPLLPCVIDGTWPAADLSGFARRLPGARVLVTIGEPIPYEEYQGRFKQTLAEVRTWSLGVLKEGRLAGHVDQPPVRI